MECDLSVLSIYPRIFLLVGLSIVFRLLGIVYFLHCCILLCSCVLLFGFSCPVIRILPPQIPG